MSGDRNPSIIKVTGKGIVKRPAEVAEFSVEIEESGDDPAELMQIVVARHNRVLETLRSELSDTEITARGTWIRRHETTWWMDDEKKDAPPEPDFDGASEIWVTTDKLDIVGILMSRAMAAGASSVSHPKFDVKDTGAMTMEAVGRAAEAAKLRAQTVASAMGLELGQPTKLEAHVDGGGGGGGGGGFGGSLFVASARSLSFGGPSDDWDIDAPTIIPSELVMTQYVSATFTLLGA